MPVRAAVHQEEYSQSLKSDLEDIVATYKTSLEKFRNDVLSFVQWLEIDEPVKEREWKDVCNYARSVIVTVQTP